MGEWCERSWHDGDCCEGSREQWSGARTWPEPEPEPIGPGYNCYSIELEHNRCQAGHPIHHDTTGRYDADTWVHCLIADVVTCPHDTEQILDVRPGKHRVQP